MNSDSVELEHCRNAVIAISEGEGLDEFTQKALAAIIQRLTEMPKGKDSNPEKLKGLIARLVVEQNPMVLPPELGGRLIAIERSFYARNA